MADRPQEQLDWLELANKCEYYTSAEIENLVNVAASLAIRAGKRIGAEDLYQAMKENPPALSAEKIEKMRLRIGFL